MGFFLYSSISKPKVYSPIPCFFLLCSISHAFANPLCFLKWIIRFDGLYTVFIFSFIHIGFFFTLLTKSVGFVSFLSPMQHSHIHTVFKHYNEHDEHNDWKAKKLYNVTDWWKLVKKKQDEMEKNWVVWLLTMEEAGSKRALGPKNSCESEHWKYSRKLCFSGHRRSVLIASRTSPSS